VLRDRPRRGPAAVSGTLAETSGGSGSGALGVFPGFSAADVDAILANVPARWRLPLRTLEQTGMRVGEAHALEWRDVDITRCRFSVRNGKTATVRRWIEVPEWLMAEITETMPPNDRTAERRVFTGLPRTWRRTSWARLQGRRDRPLPPARPAPPRRLDEGRRRRAGDDARRAARALAQVADPRRVQPRLDQRGHGIRRPRWPDAVLARSLLS
jgi:integrase